MKIIILLLTLITLEGCARTTEREISKTSANESISVNGEKSENYYDRYLYRVIGNCNDKVLYFNYLESENLPLKPDSDGKEIKAKLEVFLNKDHTFQANYEERKIAEQVEDGYRYGILFKKQISSTWEINKNGDIVLNNIGVGSPTLLNRSPSFIFKITDDIHQPGLKGQLFFLTMIFSTGSWELIDSHCKNKNALPNN